MRRLHLLSGSKLALAGLCAASARPDYPHADVVPANAARIGTSAHRAIANYIASGSSGLPVLTAAPADPDDEKISRLYDSWRRRYALEFGSSRGHAEVTYAFDAVERTARVLGQDLDRKYEAAGLLPTEIPVTVDLVRFDDKGCISVFDWKTGFQRNGQPIESHAQLRAGGYCAAKCRAVTYVRIVLSYIDEDDVHEHVATLDAFDLAAIEEDLVALYQAATSQPEPRPGAHCGAMWCGAAAGCPALIANAEAVAFAAENPSDPDAIDIVTSNAAAIRSKEHAADVHSRLVQYEAFAKACWQALDAYVDVHGPVPLADGRLYSEVEETRDSIRLDDASDAALRSALGEHAHAAIKRSVSQEAIKDATKAMVGGGRRRVELERGIMSSLEALGAARVSRFTTHRAVKPNKT